LAAGLPPDAASVVFYIPPNAGPEWTDTELWRRARAIPGLRVVADVDGREARRFGARTSGEVLVYARDGTLAFEGGITCGRGQEGDNAGLRAAATALRGATGSPRDTPVFGCAILGPAACSACAEGFR
jgi:hypothetical protein